MTIRNPALLTVLPIWAPRYSSAYTESRERVALLSKQKVDFATPVVLVKFTRAKHLEGQRYCILKETAQSYPVDSNGVIPCYAVPMSAFESWETHQEVAEIANSLFN